MAEIFTGSIVDKTQADGAQTITLSQGDRFRLHQIQLVPSAIPAAGTLQVSIKTPGASDFSDIGDAIDMTDSTEYVMQFSGFASHIKFTPTSFDAAKTYSVFVCSGAGR